MAVIAGCVHLLLTAQLAMQAPMHQKSCKSIMLSALAEPCQHGDRHHVPKPGALHARAHSECRRCTIYSMPACGEHVTLAVYISSNGISMGYNEDGFSDRVCCRPEVCLCWCLLSHASYSSGMQGSRGHTVQALHHVYQTLLVSHADEM